MLSREQIESVRAMLVKGVGPMVPVFTDLCDMATEALDTERDAALGAACRTAVADGETEYGVDFALVAADPSATEATDAFARDVFDAISAHIREEQKGET